MGRHTRDRARVRVGRRQMRARYLAAAGSSPRRVAVASGTHGSRDQCIWHPPAFGRLRLTSTQTCLTLVGSSALLRANQASMGRSQPFESHSGLRRSIQWIFLMDWSMLGKVCLISASPRLLTVLLPSAARSAVVASASSAEWLPPSFLQDPKQASAQGLPMDDESKSAGVPVQG